MSINISIIIPVLNEELVLGRNLEFLKSILAAGPPEGQTEIIVVDGGSSDDSVEVAKESQVLVFTSAPGRAKQMNHGAGKARGEMLLFLHADTRLTSEGIKSLWKIFPDRNIIGGRFDLEIESEFKILKLVARMINFRSRLTGICTGDQAIFIRREVFGRLGGFPEQPLMEDLELSRRMKKMRKIACLKSKVITSGRRWESKGIIRTILLMWFLRLLYFFGVNPIKLKKIYHDSR